MEKNKAFTNEEKVDELETKLFKYTKEFGALKLKCREFNS